MTSRRFRLLSFLVLTLWPLPSLACTVQLDQPEVVFPVEKMDDSAICRVAEVVNDYTTYQGLSSVQVPVAKPLYDFLLDHPVITSNVVRHFNLGGYHMAQIGTAIYRGEDNEGAEGILTLLYQDPTRRIYHLKGSQRGYIIPAITGSGIIMLNYHTNLGQDGRESVETRVTVFSRLDNRFLAHLAKVLRPILQRVINNKLTKGVKTVHRLTDLLARDPEGVMREVDRVAVDAKEAEEFRGLLLPAVKKGG